MISPLICVALLATAAAARSRSETMCEAGDALRCHEVGYAAATGSDGDYDPVRALRLLQRACDLGARDACVDRSRFAARFTVELDAQIASCSQGDTTACGRGADLAAAL